MKIKKYDKNLNAHVDLQDSFSKNETVNEKSENSNAKAYNKNADLKESYEYEKVQQQSNHDKPDFFNNKSSKPMITVNPKSRSKSIARRSYKRSTSLQIQQSIKRKKNLNFTIMITIVFFCCQLPIRIFLCWSYLLHYFKPIAMDYNQREDISYIYNINLLSQFTTLIYFLHCISNCIIYNILSIKFRRVFIKSFRNILFFKFKFN
jgi:hypothetical protein